MREMRDTALFERKEIISLEGSQASPAHLSLKTYKKVKALGWLEVVA
jgi:hypothetical protein